MARWTDLERFVFLLVALFFVFCQAIALVGMGWLWLMAGYWALAGLLVILPPLFPLFWLLRQALLPPDCNEDPCVDPTSDRDPKPIQRSAPPPALSAGTPAVLSVTRGPGLLAPPIAKTALPAYPARSVDLLPLLLQISPPNAERFGLPPRRDPRPEPASPGEVLNLCDLTPEERAALFQGPNRARILSHPRRR